MKQFNIKKLTLRFTSYAWSKIVHINSLSTAEVSAFGISNAKNLLLVEDIAVIKQKVTGVSTLFDDEAIADFFLDQVEAGRKPEQFGRIWIHTHPSWFTQQENALNNIIPTPSPTDEGTFERAFGSCDWAIMFIYGSGSSGYARLSLKKRFRGQIMLPVTIGNDKQSTVADEEEWEREFKENVTEEILVIPAVRKRYFGLQPTQHYSQLTSLLDTDIDTDEFAQFIETFGHAVENFCRYEPARRQWWINEFRKDKEMAGHNITTNPYY